MCIKHDQRVTGGAIQRRLEPVGTSLCRMKSICRPKNLFHTVSNSSPLLTQFLLSCEKVVHIKQTNAIIEFNVPPTALIKRLSLQHHFPYEPLKFKFELFYHLIIYFGNFLNCYERVSALTSFYRAIYSSISSLLPSFVIFFDL